MFYGEGVKFIAGKDFDTEYGHHEAGSEVKEAKKFGNLDALVGTGWLYPVVPDEGYDTLPPHLFSLVQTRAEVQAVLDGDRSHVEMSNEQHPGLKPESVQEAEKQVALDEVGRELVKAHQARNAYVRAHTDDQALPQVLSLDEATERRVAKQTAEKKAEPAPAQAPSQKAPVKQAEPQKTAVAKKAAAPAQKKG